MSLDLDILPTFLDEAQGYLKTLKDPESSWDKQWKAAHGLKGAAAIIGLDRINRAATQLEKALLQDHPQTQSALIEHLHLHLEHLRTHGEEAKLAPFCAVEDEPRYSNQPPPPIEDEFDPETTAMLHEIFIEEACDHLEAITAALVAFEQDPNPSYIDEMMRKAHTLKGSASTVGLSQITEAAHLLEENFLALKGDLLEVDPHALDLLLEAVDLLREMTSTIKPPQENEAKLSQLRDKLNRVFLSTDKRVEKRNRRKTSTQDHLSVDDTIEALPPSEKTITETHGQPSHHDRRRGYDRRLDDVQQIRVDVKRMDNLQNSVGELVIQRTRIEQRIEELKGLARDLNQSRRAMHNAMVDVEDLDAHPSLIRLREIEVEVADAVSNIELTNSALIEDSESLRRTSHDLQSDLTQIRMMPIRWLHARLRRPVREAASSQGKLIELITDEESAQMDRSVIEHITDPLIHLMRNAVVHGIERPEIRVAAGKSPTGQIKICVRRHGDLVTILVEDDGAGVDYEILRRAMKKQYQIDEAELEKISNDELLKLIFKSGFSTRSSADNLSGRGVGLDIVHQNIMQLGGKILVSSAVGKGTTFTIRLPITTAIADGLLFKVGEPVYVIPISYVVETMLIDPSLLRELHEHCQIRLRERWIPVVFLHTILGGTPPLPHYNRGDPTTPKLRLPIIILRHEDRLFAVTCSRVIGPREVVLKPVGRLLSMIPLFAGATISGSSRVQFVLDVTALAHRAFNPQRLPYESPTHEVVHQHASDDLFLDTSLELSQNIILRLQKEASRSNNLPNQPAPIRVLLVDDSRSIRATVSLILRTAGYSVDAVSDGWEAWEKLHLISYDLLLTDLEMPRMHGFSLISKCRHSEDLRQLKILVLTSRVSVQTRQKAFNMGADGFIPKPVRSRLLLKEIQDLLPTRQRPASP